MPARLPSNHASYSAQVTMPHCQDRQAIRHRLPCHIAKNDKQSCRLLDKVPHCPEQLCARTCNHASYLPHCHSYLPQLFATLPGTTSNHAGYSTQVTMPHCPEQLCARTSNHASYLPHCQERQAIMPAIRHRLPCHIAQNSCVLEQAIMPDILT